MARRTAERSRSASRITYGAPMQVCLAGSNLSPIRRITVILLTPNRVAASCRFTSPRSARSPSRYTAIWWSLRKTVTRCWAHVWPFAVVIPRRFRMAAMVRSGAKRARSRISCSISALVFQRCSPGRFFTTSSVVWSPPFQWSLSCSRSDAAVRTISSSTVRRIRLRVAAVAPEWFHRRGRSVPSAKISVRSTSDSAGDCVS